MRIRMAVCVALLITLLRPEPGAAPAWTRMSEGNGCWIPDCPDGRWPLAVRPVAGPGGRLWMYEHGFAWSSTDGVAWREEARRTGWGERYGAGRAYALDRLWFLGGGQTWSRFENDVWSSRDGVEWERAASAAPWGPRRSHLAVEFSGRLWVLGGQQSAGREALPVHTWRDVWSTADGRAWVRHTERAPWSAAACAVVFRGRLWVIADGTAWHTADGAHWASAAGHPVALARRGAGCAAYGGRLWVFGGIGAGDTTRNDVWSTADGTVWAPAVPAPWSPRGAEHSAVFRGALWLFGGKTGRDDGYADDVWTLR